MSINSKTKAAVDTLLTDNATTESEFQTGLEDVTTELDSAQQKLAGATAIVHLKDTVYTLSGTVIDPDNGQVQSKALAANTTFTESLNDGESVILHITGGDTYTITWPTLTWVTSAGNAAPTQTASDVYVLWQVGSTVYAAYTGSYV